MYINSLIFLFEGRFLITHYSAWRMMITFIISRRSLIQPTNRKLMVSWIRDDRYPGVNRGGKPGRFDQQSDVLWNYIAKRPGFPPQNPKMILSSRPQGGILYFWLHVSYIRLSLVSTFKSHFSQVLWVIIPHRTTMLQSTGIAFYYWLMTLIFLGFSTRSCYPIRLWAFLF